MKKLLAVLFIIGLMCCAPAAQAQVSFDFDGTIVFENDVVLFQTTFECPSGQFDTIEIWTDSFAQGNFDPMLGFWNATTGDLIAFNDDNDTIDPATQGVFDSGLVLNDIANGTYIISVTRYSNFNNGDNLADGFQDDGLVNPTLVPVDQNFYHVNVEGVCPAPIPGSLLLLGSGIMGLVGIGIRRKS